MINVGMVGFGLSGRFLQAPFFQINESFNLKQIVTSQEIPENLFPTTKKTASFDDLLADDSLELITICSPSSTHYEYAKRCLNAGKHILIEKPMTATLDEAKELFKLAEEKSKVIYVFQNRRFDGDFMTVKNIINSGILGVILSYEAHFDRFKPILNAKKWKELPSPANGILYDLGSHLIDQALYLFGEPTKLNGEVFTQRENSEIDDAFDIRMTFGKVKVTLKSSLMVKELGPKYSVHGTLGSYIKYGIDNQEDHLVAGFWPTQPGFGYEGVSGTISSNINGIEISGNTPTLAGNWGLLFENLAAVIKGEQQVIVKPQEILNQLSIIESIKR